MKLKPTYMRFALAALAAGLLAAVCGCSRDNGAGDADMSGSNYRMSVTVVTSSASTRAGHADDFEEKGTTAENFIDFASNDFRVVLFTSAGEYLLELDGLDKWEVFPYPNGDYTYYQMECELEFPESMTDEELDLIKNNGLQAMVLANWQSAEGPAAYDNLFRADNGRQNLAAIWSDGTHYNFNYAAGTGNLSWRPDHTAAAKRLIPMFGYAQSSKFSPSNGNILYSSAIVQMQRAVAKIEVIDNLKEEQQLNVTDVEMTSFNTSGRFITDVAQNPDWNKTGSQVDRSSLPTGVTQNNAGLKFFSDVSGKKWTAYVPEMNLGTPPKNDKGEFVFPDSRPHLNVKIDSRLDFYKGDTFPLHFARYDEKTFLPTIPDESWNHILRNHIYRFSINKVGVFVQMHLHVIPWDKEEDEEWDFTDHVAVTQLLEWLNTKDENGNSKPSYDGTPEDIKTNGEVMLLLDGTSLVGEFNIKSPVNGRWYARLVPIGDAKTNAVTFVDESGEVMDPSGGDPKACLEVSGLIDGKGPQRIYIKPTDLGNDYESTYRLEFYVENLNVWMDVMMNPNPTDGNWKYYTIVRKANIIETNI